MKIFRVKATKTIEIETLVISKSTNEAKMLTLMCIKNKELNFDDVVGDGDIGISGICPVNISDRIIKEIKDYGIIDGQAKIIYDPSVVEKISEDQKKQQKEEWLKENHLEFKFN